MIQKKITKVKRFNRAIASYEKDTIALLDSHILIASIDGVEVDSGVSCEIGIACGWNELVGRTGRGKPIYIIGLYTHMRQYGTGDGHMYRNLFTLGAVEQFGVIVASLDDLTIRPGCRAESPRWCAYSK